MAAQPSAAEATETVRISPAAREASLHPDAVMTSGLEGAIVDLRVAKYAFIANLEVLQTGVEVEKTAAELLK